MAAKRSRKPSKSRSRKPAKKTSAKVAKPRQRAPGAGRKPKPTALKVLHGTDQKCRVREDEPEPDVGAPALPDWLDQETADTFAAMAAELLGMRVLTRADGPSYVLLVTAYVRYKNAWIAYREHGAYGERSTQHDSYKVRSAYAIELDAAYRHLSTMCSHFGVSPASRAKVGAVPQAGGDKPAETRGARFFRTA